MGPNTRNGDWRFWGAWGLAFLGFPLGGLAGQALTGGIETAVDGLLGGAATGAVVGAVQWLVLRRRIPLNAWWIAATGGGDGGRSCRKYCALRQLHRTYCIAATWANHRISDWRRPIFALAPIEQRRLYLAADSCHRMADWLAGNTNCRRRSHAELDGVRLDRRMGFSTPDRAGARMDVSTEHGVRG